MATITLNVPANVWTPIADDSHEVLAAADQSFFYAFGASTPADDVLGYLRSGFEELVVVPPAGMNLYVRNQRVPFAISVTEGAAA